MHAKVKYLATTGSTGAYTQNNEYDVLGFSAASSAAYAVVIDDNGVPAGVQVDNNTWAISQAYVAERIV